MIQTNQKRDQVVNKQSHRIGDIVKQIKSQKQTNDELSSHVQLLLQAKNDDKECVHGFFNGLDGKLTSENSG